MITKLSDLEEPPLRPSKESVGQIVSAISNELGQRGEIKNLQLGSRSITFVHEYQVNRFVKTYFVQSGLSWMRHEELLQNVATEGIAQCTYHEFATRSGENKQSFIGMRELRPGKSLSARECVGLVQTVSNRIQETVKQEEMVERRFDVLIEVALQALPALVNAGVITPELAGETGNCLSRLIESNADQQQVLSHGDFGPRNVLLCDDTPIVVDWEDAIMAPRNYDYLYWLTFIENRSSLLRGSHHLANLPSRFAVDVLVLIVTLKSYMSLRKELHLRLRVSIQTRISEVVGLLQ